MNITIPLQKNSFNKRNPLILSLDFELSGFLPNGQMEIPSSATNTRPPDEMDKLERNAKKTRTTIHSIDSEFMEVEDDSPKAIDGEEGDNPSIKGTSSYKNVLTGNNQMQKIENRLEGNISENDDDEEETHLECPVIKVTKKEKIRLRERFRQSLIIKVWGKKIGYTILLKRITALWRPKCRM